MTLGSLDTFYEKLKVLRDRVCFAGIPEVVEIHRDDLVWIGRQVLVYLLDDRKDIVPTGCQNIFNWSECLSFGKQVVEKLFNFKTAINETTSLGVKGHIKAYRNEVEEFTELK